LPDPLIIIGMKIYEEEDTLIKTATPPSDVQPEISIFLPVYNEEPNLLPLHEKLDQALTALGRSAEIIYVDDGSTDGSLRILHQLAERDSRVRVRGLGLAQKPARQTDHAQDSLDAGQPPNLLDRGRATA
jgi:cellulose synthase/poly-beta-1,6-N-acetylglucosamine synthase-like glycosyltransferase